MRMGFLGVLLTEAVRSFFCGETPGRSTMMKVRSVEVRFVVETPLEGYCKTPSVAVVEERVWARITTRMF